MGFLILVLDYFWDAKSQIIVVSFRGFHVFQYEREWMRKMEVPFGMSN